MRNFNVITDELEEESTNNDVKCIYKEVVVVGNGPSGITLSYLLNGYRPYYNKIPHPDPMLSARLIECTHKSLLHQDLSFLSQGIEGRSKNPISLLIDAMIHPGADMGLEWPSLLTWKKTAEVLDHIVLGKGDPGGTWPAVPDHVLTISPGRWMALPGLEFKEYHEKRAPAVEVAKYYMEYVNKHDLTPYMSSHSTVTMIQPIVNKLRKRARWKVWVTNANGGTVTYECRHLVLAIGSSDKAGCLGVPGECLPYITHNIRNFEELLLKKSEKLYFSPRMTWTSTNDEDDVTHLCCQCNPAIKTKINGYVPDEESVNSAFCQAGNGDCNYRKLKTTGKKDLFNGWQEKEPQSSLINRNKALNRLCNIDRHDHSLEFLNERIGTNSVEKGFRSDGKVWIDSQDVSEPNDVNVSLDKFETSDNEEQIEEKPKVLVVGAGLSAADAILAAWRKNRSVIHAFRNPLTSTKLPEVMYPEYHELHRLMEGLDSRKDYHPLPGYQVTEFFKDNTVELIDSAGARKRIKVFAVAILVGSRPDLSFLPKNLKNLGIDASQPIDCKLNPIQIDPFSYKCIRAPPGLYALGSLVGDNFVRFLQGGAVAVAGHIFKDNSFHRNLK